ncbi:MAG: transketolase family protein [Deltaproteobacteria bacterium]|nr:transketolase family protein [Deltaproteobacteria bacterium]
MLKTIYLREKRDTLENMYVAHNRALVQLAEKNEKIVSVYGDFPSGEVGEVFQEKYPDRLIDVGIAEGHLITSAAGLADAGWIPFTHCHDIFALGRGYNQIRQNLAYDNRNAKVVLCNSGVVWPAIGPSHQTIEDIAALRAIPNLLILSPSDAISTEKATFAAADYVGPVILRLPFTGAAFPILYANDFEFEIGKAVCIHEGSDVAILATGILVNSALQVAEELEKEGIQVRVLDIQTIKPLDEEAILSAAKETDAIVTVEDGNIYGGLGGAVSELTSENYPVLVKRVGVKDQFGDSGTIEEIKECLGLTPPMIKQAVYEVMERKGTKKKRKGRK